VEVEVWCVEAGVVGGGGGGGDKDLQDTSNILDLAKSVDLPAIIDAVEVEVWCVEAGVVGS